MNIDDSKRYEESKVKIVAAAVQALKEIILTTQELKDKYKETFKHILEIDFDIKAVNIPYGFRNLSS